VTADDKDPAAVERPLLRVVRGDPSADELAALVAVLATRATITSGAPASRRTAWNDPARLVRAPLHPRDGGWHASARPS